MKNFQFYPFHIIYPSPWPLYLYISLISLTTSAVLSFHGFSYAENNLILSLTSLVLSMSLWFRDIIAEGTYLGNHPLAVQRGLNIGVGLFILSEARPFYIVIHWPWHLYKSPKPHAFDSFYLESSFNIFRFLKSYTILLK